MKNMITKTKISNMKISIINKNENNKEQSAKAYQSKLNLRSPILKSCNKLLKNT